MARPLRIEYPSALYHITSRGNAKQDIFLNDADRKLFLFLLNEVAKKYNWVYYAYCLMSNHYHLLIETLDGKLSLGMRQLNGVYTQKFNKIHERTGHIFQGRFKAILVDKDSYLLELCRYIVLNPVRAGLVKLPEEWNWSSYGVILGILPKGKFLDSDWVLSQFDENKEGAKRLYREFVLGGMNNDSPWGKLKGRLFLGNDNFITKTKALIEEKKEMNEIPKINRFVARPHLNKIFNLKENRLVRNNKVYIAYFNYGYALREIGDFLGLHYSTISKILARQGNDQDKNSKIKT